MKKGICYGTLAGDTIEQRFELAKAAGFEGVEINTQENSPDRKKFKSVADVKSHVRRVHAEIELSFDVNNNGTFRPYFTEL